MARRKRRTKYSGRPRTSVPGSSVQHTRSASASERSPQKQRGGASSSYQTDTRQEKRPPVRSARNTSRSKRRHTTRDVQPFTFREARRTRHRRRRESNSRVGEVLYRVLLTLMVSAALFFILSVFFEVKNIEVIGSEHYVSEYVADISGVKTGDKLIFINAFEIKQNLFAELPYVKEVRVRRHFPNTVVLELTEREPAAKLVAGDISYIIDEETHLLDYTALGDAYPLPIIYGAEPSSRELGKPLTFKEPMVQDALQTVLTELVKYRWIAQTEEIHMEKIYDISFRYGDRFQVVLGDSGDLPYKLSVLREVLSRLDETDHGVINLSTPEMARFQPNVP